MMPLTHCHTKYFAHELMKRCVSNSVEKLAGALVDAQVDLNPHQVEAALFAFKSPLFKGAILADEVGSGTTIEQVREARRAATAVLTLEEKLEAQKCIKAIEAQRNTRRRALFDA